MKPYLKSVLKSVGIFAVVLALAACSSKKKSQDESLQGDNAAPQIESTPMGYDPVGSDSGKIEGLQTVFFEYDQASLTAEGKRILAGNAQWMKRNQGNMQIEGHCDARGSIEYNLSLGERRAKTVKKHMESLGIASDRLSIISYGKEKPLVQGDSEEAYSRNRRANFVPLPR